MLGLLAGLVVLVVGLLAIGFGIPVKEFSFGNTLIVTGVLGACTGAVLIGLSVILRELKSISRALGAAAPASEGRPRNALEAFPGRGVPASAEPGMAMGEGSAVSTPEPPPPWQDQLAARGRPPGQDMDTAPRPEPAPEEGEQPAKKRRNLLFMSSKRDRPQPLSEPHQEYPLETAAPPPAPVLAAEPPATFEDAWPASDRPRPDSARRAPRSAGASEPADAREAAKPGVAAPPPVRRPAEAPPVTILKSGVVDGMAYSLYSDGSIEAQMAEGMVRFASIDELRNHLDQRG